MVVEATKDTLVTNLSSSTLEEEAEVNMEEVMVVMEVSGVMERLRKSLKKLESR